MEQAHSSSRFAHCRSGGPRVCLLSSLRRQPLRVPSRCVQHAQDVVYVIAKQAWLRDRVAPVSTKIAPVGNGEKLKVLDHERRFFQVQAPDGRTGWIEEHFVIDQPTYDKFEALGRDTRKIPSSRQACCGTSLCTSLSRARHGAIFPVAGGRQAATAGAGKYRKLTPVGRFRAQQRKAAEDRAAAAADRLVGADHRRAKDPHRRDRSSWARLPRRRLRRTAPSCPLPCRSIPMRRLRSTRTGG